MEAQDGFFYQCFLTRKDAVPRLFFTDKDKESDQRLVDESFDESLGFHGRKRFILASSNGFLLCTTKRLEPLQYYVYNPATRQSPSLPKRTKSESRVAIGFSCKVTDPEKDLICFTVIRCEMKRFWPLWCSTQPMEIFYSKTGEWKMINLTNQLRKMMESSSGLVSKA